MKKKRESGYVFEKHGHLTTEWIINQLWINNFQSILFRERKKSEVADSTSFLPETALR